MLRRRQRDVRSGTIIRELSYRPQSRRPAAEFPGDFDSTGALISAVMDDDPFSAPVAAGASEDAGPEQVSCPPPSLSDNRILRIVTRRIQAIVSRVAAIAFGAPAFGSESEPGVTTKGPKAERCNPVGAPLSPRLARRPISMGTP